MSRIYQTTKCKQGLVLVVVVVFGIVLGLIDFGFTELVNRVFIGS